MHVRLDTMSTLPGMKRAVTATFSNAWKPGELRVQIVPNIIEAISLLEGDEWCWIPDESGYEALPADHDILADHLRSGDPAVLMSRVNADLVHLKPATE